jgi:mono/diheme cytochrome c family protein
VKTEQQIRRRRLWPRIIGSVLGVGIVTGAVYLGMRLTTDRAVAYDGIEEHFKYGSIGSESTSGMPYWLWKVLPVLFADKLPASAKGYEAFGFLYETDANSARRDLPIGISQRNYRGVDLVWLNCAICHTGTYRAEPDGKRQIVLGMPSNNFDLFAFIRFLFDAAADERFSADRILAAMDGMGADLSWFDRLQYRYLVIPRVRDGLLQRRSRLEALLAEQPAWGPGRVDTFNPYKVGVFNFPAAQLPERERIGTSDFPSVWQQQPRRDMQLHWDGNNPSLHERNLSAAIGAGVTPTTVDHEAIGRVATWLQTLNPPANPLLAGIDQDKAARGKALYAERCAACHGSMQDQGYDFTGSEVGKVTPIAAIGTDRARMDSYTEELAANQNTLFAAYPEHHFRHFRKTFGYANMPLEGLWLRAPYLHNGSVPTLHDLLEPAADRPVTFFRGDDRLDPAKDGFRTDAAADGPHRFFEYDTRRVGNGKDGHEYGTDLTADQKQDLLEYLKTF